MCGTVIFWLFLFDNKPQKDDLRLQTAIFPKLAKNLFLSHMSIKKQKRSTQQFSG